jgi:hypothetical protein
VSVKSDCVVLPRWNLFVLLEVHLEGSSPLIHPWDYCS